MENSTDPESLTRIISNEILAEPDLIRAFRFYKKHILEVDRDLTPILEEYNFKSLLPDWKWECFAAILVGDKSRRGTIEKYLAKNNPDSEKKAKKGGKGNSKNGNGPDLIKNEVKARTDGMGFEYQYHKNSWKAKLEEEPKIGHILISYWNDYQDFDVRFIHGSKLNDFFEQWKIEIETKFSDKSFDGRCRPALPYKIAVTRASIILSVRSSEISFQNLELLRPDIQNNIIS